MLTYAEFTAAAPEIAEPLRAKLEATGICFLGTLRRDGSPRISPVEVSFQGDGLFFGSMPEATKALDLRRDPRCALVTPLADKDDLGGEGKAFLHALEITDPEARRARLAAAVEGTDAAVEDFGDSPMFELRFTGAAWQRVEGDSWVTTSWAEGQPVRHRRRDGASGLPVDV